MNKFLNFRFWLARKLVGKHSAAINCRATDAPKGAIAWWSDGKSTFMTNGDPR